jgi:hypothetical protein
MCVAKYSQLIREIQLFGKIVEYYQLCIASHRDNTSALIKQAFDTRRIDQETQLNPRRGAQYYQRSDAFLRETATQKINILYRVKKAVDDIKSQYIGSTEWLDSNCRSLSASLDRTLRVDQKDLDYSDTQLDYLTELLYLRYRLGMETINSLSDSDLKMKILSKDEPLTNSLYKNSNYTTAPQPPSGVDHFFSKLLDGVKASSDTSDVERSITLTVRDKINDVKKIG